jgi:DinB superfamily
MPESERETLRALLRGKGAHVDPLGAFEGLTLQTAGEKLKGAPYTVWQILGHMIYWQDYALARIRGANPEMPAHAEEGWPFAESPADPADLQTGIDLFETGLGGLDGILVDDSQNLARRLDPEKSTTVRDLIAAIIAHNSYHAGQTALLRRMIRAWPPPRGGDTW